MAKASRRRFGRWNMVRGYPDWYYGLLIRQADGSVVFGVYETGTDRKIEGLRASGYRTTTLARRFGERDLRGYEHEARVAIRGLGPVKETLERGLVLPTQDADALSARLHLRKDAHV